MAVKFPFRRRTVVFISLTLIALVAVAGFAGYSLRPYIAAPASIPTEPPTLIQAPLSTPQLDPAKLPTTFEPSVHAAELANDRCEEEFGVRPFQPDTFKLLLSDERYEWGRLDPIGVRGYSARVSFNREGRDALVSVYWSGVDHDFFDLPAYAAPNPKVDLLEP